jgi:hypothetical protein
MSSSAAEPRWAAAAFGLALSGAGRAPAGLGTGAARADPDLPSVTLTRALRRELDASWPRTGVRSISRVQVAGARRAAMQIELHPQAGHRFSGVGYGRFVVSADAREVRCAPVAARWVRYLHGQVLPLVAGLWGRELIHAGGVLTARGALAVSGPSGAGKTTLTGALRAAGCGFLADDAVALERCADGSVRAHPGPALRAVTHADGSETLEPVVAVAPTAPLYAICLLRRSPAQRQVAVEDLDPVDPGSLLQTTYDAVRRDPRRLTAQLDLFAAVAASARIVTLSAPLDAAPERLAAALLEALA